MYGLRIVQEIRPLTIYWYARCFWSTSLLSDAYSAAGYLSQNKVWQFWKKYLSSDLNESLYHLKSNFKYLRGGYGWLRIKVKSGIP